MIGQQPSFPHPQIHRVQLSIFNSLACRTAYMSDAKEEGKGEDTQLQPTGKQL